MPYPPECNPHHPPAYAKAFSRPVGIQSSPNRRLETKLASEKNSLWPTGMIVSKHRTRNQNRDCSDGLAKLCLRLITTWGWVNKFGQTRSNRC
jgi:hypothetical protein